MSPNVRELLGPCEPCDLDPRMAKYSRRSIEILVSNINREELIFSCTNRMHMKELTKCCHEGGADYTLLDHLSHPDRDASLGQARAVHGNNK